TTGDRLLVTICAGCFLMRLPRRKVMATDSPRSQSIEQSFAELKAHLRKAASDTPGMGQLILEVHLNRRRFVARSWKMTA
ncbi:MAG TPA: hypothetical protein VMT72_19795, partial [Pseudolabrys sp.]|nr:hypothetical protein [Pseudolabrys sp.]